MILSTPENMNKWQFFQTGICRWSGCKLHDSLHAPNASPYANPYATLAHLPGCKPQVPQLTFLLCAELPYVGNG